MEKIRTRQDLRLDDKINQGRIEITEINLPYLDPGFPKEKHDHREIVQLRQEHKIKGVISILRLSPQ